MQSTLNYKGYYYDIKMRIDSKKISLSNLRTDELCIVTSIIETLVKTQGFPQDGAETFIQTLAKYVDSPLRKDVFFPVFKSSRIDGQLRIHETKTES